jgi:hypothetical protein
MRVQVRFFDSGCTEGSLRRTGPERIYRIDWLQVQKIPRLGTFSDIPPPRLWLIRNSLSRNRRACTASLRSLDRIAYGPGIRADGWDFQWELGA